MPAITIVPAIVEASVAVAPALRTLQLSRGLVVPLKPIQINEAKTQEQLQRAKDTQKQTRKRLRERYNKNVIKVKDAMECCENAIDGKLILQFGRAIVSTLTGNADDLGSLLLDKINACMIEKMLRQDSARERTTYRYSKRAI